MGILTFSLKHNRLSLHLEGLSGCDVRIETTDTEYATLTLTNMPESDWNICSTDVPYCDILKVSPLKTEVFSGHSGYTCGSLSPRASMIIGIPAVKRLVNLSVVMAEGALLNCVYCSSTHLQLGSNVRARFCVLPLGIEPDSRPSDLNVRFHGDNSRVFSAGIGRHVKVICNGKYNIARVVLNGQCPSQEVRVRFMGIARDNRIITRGNCRKHIVNAPEMILSNIVIHTGYIGGPAHPLHGRRGRSLPINTRGCKSDQVTVARVRPVNKRRRASSSRSPV